jgi:putative ABC transport system permease protein
LPFFRESLNRIRALPGVEQAAWVTRLPLSGGRAGSLFLVEGRPAESATVSTVEPILATPTYFETLSIPILHGRNLSDADNEKAPPVIVVNDAFAKKYFPGEDPIGRRIRPGGPASTAPWFTIVGIVGDVRTTALDTTPTPQLYRSVWQASGLSMALAVRVTRDPASISRAVVAAIHSIDRELPLYAMQPMDEVLRASTAERRFAMIVVSVFAGLALVLSAIGIYGVLSYIVHQRTSEIGLRMALGAETGSVLRLVLGEGLLLAGTGIGIGLAGAWLVGQAVASMLFGIGPMDPLSFVGISLLLTIVAIAACAVPAVRAMRIDPLLALRH